jgi:hypothetical protein
MGAMKRPVSGNEQRSHEGAGMRAIRTGFEIGEPELSACANHVE